MQLMNPFDATKFDPTQGGGGMPVGKHPVIICESEVKPTRDNSGGLLELTLQIIDGPAKGQKGAYRLNLYNQSQQAVEIAHRQLSAICHAIGVFQVQDSQQLHNIPFIVDVALQKDPEAAKKGYTEVTRIYDRNGNEPGKPNTQGAPAQTAQNAQGGGGWGQPAQGGQPGTNAPAGSQPAWGQGNQQQQPANQQQQAPNQGGGWNQNAGGGGGNAPWGQK